MFNENTSFKNLVIRNVQQTAGNLFNTAKDTSLDPIVTETVVGARSFVTALLLWMSTTYQTLLEQMGLALGDNNWKFICHSVHSIFEEMYLLRRGGENLEPVGQVWYCLKCHNFQQEIFQLGFSKHRIVQKVLFHHLKTDFVLKSVHDKDIAALTNKIEDLLKSLQKVAAKVGK